MAQRTLPGIGLVGGWSSGEDGWGVEMNQNLIKLSILVQTSAESVVETLPPIAADGEIYLLEATAPLNPGMIAARDDGLWRYVQPQLGWRVFVKSASSYYQYFGGGWVATASAASLPAFSPAVAGYNLSVNVLGNGVTWTPPYESPYDIPVFGVPQIGYNLKVAADGAGVKMVWETPPPSLPAIPADSKGKVAVIDPTGTAFTYEEDGKYKLVSPGYVVTNDDLTGRVILGATGDITIPAGLTRSSTLTIVRMTSGDVRIGASGAAVLNVADGRTALRTRYSAVSIIRTGPEAYTMFGDVAA